MTHDEMTKLALEQVKQNNPESSNFKVIKVFDNIMDGAVVSVGFRTPTPSDKDDSNHIWFRGRESRAYRWHSDIVNAVSAYKERRWFFRFIELAGVNGVIAFALILIFSALLCALLVTHPDTYQTILELVKLSFSVILGYFFGSQAGGKKDSSSRLRKKGFDPPSRRGQLSETLGFLNVDGSRAPFFGGFSASC